jgi:hypothetical protein
MRRARWLLVLGLVPALITLTTTSAFAQRYRTSDDNDRWLDRCRDDRYSDRDRDRYCEVREKTIPATRLLDVDGGQNGGIAIHAWDRDEIRVSARIQTSGDDDGDAKALADQISIEVRDGRVRAEGPSTRRRQSWSVSYDIYAPRRTDLRLNAQNGGLSVEDIEGRMDLGTVNGRLGRGAGRRSLARSGTRRAHDKWRRHTRHSARLLGAPGNGHGERLDEHRLPRHGAGLDRSSHHDDARQRWPADSRDHHERWGAHTAEPLGARGV